MSISLRKAREEDIEGIICLFRETILTVNAQDYKPEQTSVWASAGLEVERWRQRIREQHFMLAEEEGELTGFASVAPAGYLDMLYVHKNHQRKGIAGMLLKAMEDFCRQQGVPDLYSDVSITARPFFQQHGFLVEEEQRKWLKGVEFINYRMRKVLQ